MQKYKVTFRHNVKNPICCVLVETTFQSDVLIKARQKVRETFGVYIDEQARTAKTVVIERV